MSKAADLVGLPPKPFFYTIEQVAYLLNLEERYVKNLLLHYQERSVGPCPRDKIYAVNMAPAGETPVWRVNERSLVSFMRFKGLRYYERGYVK